MGKIKEFIQSEKLGVFAVRIFQASICSILFIIFGDPLIKWKFAGVAFILSLALMGLWTGDEN